MARSLRHSMLLSMVVLLLFSACAAASEAEKRDEQTPIGSTSSANAQKVASWEVKADGSVSAKKTPTQEVAEGRREDTRVQVGARRAASGVVSERPAAIEEEWGDGDDSQWEEVTEQEGDKRTEEGVQLQLVEPSGAFLDLEDRVTEEGYTPELVEELETMAAGRAVETGLETEHDWAFALTKLAYLQLFEPNATSTDEQVFVQAISDLHLAANTGVTSAVGLLAMLDLADIPVPLQLEQPASREEKRLRANQVLVSLAGSHDFMATLAVGYGLLSGRLPLPSKHTDGTPINTAADDAECAAALPFFHTCAEQNVHVIVDEGGERPVEVVRLSDELLEPNGGGFFDDYGFGGADPLHDENEALHELEYYRTIANNPMDEQYPQAMQRLGEIHFFGNPAAHVAPDHGLAAQYFRQAADAGDPLAQANYGMLLANGMGVDQDVRQAIVYFDRAARQNEAFAFHGLGVLYFTGTGVPRNVTLALEYFEKAIARGYAESHSFLGSAYLHGDGGVAIDLDLAFKHFQAAVDGTKGQSSQALFNLGVMHFQGIGTPQSCKKALPLFRTVALHPDLLTSLPFSLIKAYECYKKGDYLRAYLHYRLVAELGDEDAQCNAAFLLEHQSDSILKWQWLGLAESSQQTSNPQLREAFALYSQAAALNDSEAVRKTGACFHEPWIGVCQSNHTRALERYQLAAELGDAQAGYNCGLMLLTGDGVPRDLSAARSYYAHCSEAAFPANMPCALALVGLDVLQVLHGATRFWTG